MSSTVITNSATINMSRHIGISYRIDNVGEIRNRGLAVFGSSGWHVLVGPAVLTTFSINFLLGCWLEPLTALTASGCLGCKPVSHTS